MKNLNGLFSSGGTLILRGDESSWVGSVAYDADVGVMLLITNKGDHYKYRVNLLLLAEMLLMAQSRHSLGSAVNWLVREHPGLLIDEKFEREAQNYVNTLDETQAKVLAQKLRDKFVIV